MEPDAIMRELEAQCLKFHDRSPMAICREAVDEGVRRHCVICRAAAVLAQSREEIEHIHPLEAFAYVRKMVGKLDRAVIAQASEHEPEKIEIVQRTLDAVGECIGILEQAIKEDEPTALAHLQQSREEIERPSTAANLRAMIKENERLLAELSRLRAEPERLSPDVLADALQDRITPVSGRLLASHPVLSASPPAAGSEQAK